jgi:hypothetical protein
VPDGRDRALDDADAEEPPRDLEHALQHALQREVGPQRLLVEVEALAPQPLHQESDVPRLDRLEAERASVRGELLDLTPPVRPRALGQVGDELERARAALHHALLERVVGVGLIAEHAGELAPKLEDAAEQRAVVVRAVGRAVHVRGVHALAQLAPFGVLHERRVGGHLQREPPAVEALRPGRVTGACARGVRQPGELGLVGQEQLEGVRRVERVVREAGVQLRELHADLLHALLRVGRQVGAGAAELAQRLLQVAPSHAAQRPGLVGLREFAHRAPEPVVQWQLRVESRELGQDGVVRLAQLRRVHHRDQVRDRADHAVKPVDQVVQPLDGARIGTRRGVVVDQRVQLGLGFGERRAHGGHDVLGADAVERDLEFARQ